MNASEKKPLPNSWSLTRIQDISETTSGGTPSRKNKEFFMGKIPWLKSGELADNLSIDSSEEAITEQALNNSSAKIIPKGSLLVALYGATVGKLGLLAMDAAINQAVCAILPYQSVDSKYLFYYLSSYRKNFLNARKGGAQPNISQEIVKNAPIPLAPFAEQLRIVGKVEELFSFLNAGTDSLHKVQAQLKLYRQAVLKYAFEGKLTEEWRKAHKDQIEPAQKLIEYIKQEKRNNSKYIDLPPINLSVLSKIPDKWTSVRLGEVLFLSNERYNPITSENECFVGLEHIASGTGKLLGFGKSSVTISTKNRFKKGDLLYGKLRPYLNKVWVANFDGVCSTDILVFKKNNFISNAYLAAFLSNQDFVEYARQHMSGVQHPRISYQVLSQYILPLPPFSEQVVIVDKIQRSFSIAELTKGSMQQVTKQAEILRQTILKTAFEGKPVPQDPADEPANKLLERIIAEHLNIKKSNSNNQLELSGYVK